MSQRSEPDGPAGSALVIRSGAARADETPVANVAEIEDLTDFDLGDGPVTVRVTYSGINYKDALALTGRPGVVRTTPLVAGIDLVGTVSRSEDPRWSAGDRVLLNGDGLSETRHGGLGAVARVGAESLIRVPDALSDRQAAALGTAGYTAALGVIRLEKEGLAAGAEVLVTGSTGGVGSVAIMLLARAGYRVTALTGRAAEYGDYLRSLGAIKVIERAEFAQPAKPLQRQAWLGAIDTVGGQVLANVLARIDYGGTVAACGLAGGASLPATVLPFILRAVTLAGIDSVHAAREPRQAAWHRLGRDIDPTLLETITREVPLREAVSAAEDLLAGRTHGRIVVDVRA